MFHLQSLELLQWDYCQRLTLPLDGAIITVAGPNGSGKTTLLDAMRTLLGLDCSGGRNYKTYARHANADTTWLRAVVDNRPHGRQTSSRPFARNLLYADQVTLACRIDRNGGDWQRRYLMADGDVPVETLIQAPDKDWLGIEHWRKRLEGAGLSRAIARVLALEQGQTDRLCEYSPKELLRLVFDVFGDQEVLDRYEEARRHLREQEAEVEVADRELAHGRAQLAELETRVTQYRQYQMRLREREELATEVVPVLEWHEDRHEVTQRLNELRRQRLQHAAHLRQRTQDRARLLALLEARQTAEARVGALEKDKDQAQAAQRQARDAERPVEDLVKQADELQKLAAIEGDAAQLAERVRELEAGKSELDRRWHAASDRRTQARTALEGLQGQRQAPMPPEVQRFQRTLRQQDIAHHLMADVIEITDESWRAAAEGVLRAARWVVVLHDPQDEGRAMALAEKERYRHYLVAEAEHAPATPPADSLLAVLRFADTAPNWLLHQLAQIRRVADTQAGARAGGEWITPQAYWRDRRGGRSVWVDPAEHQFGAAALTARADALQRQLAQLDEQLTDLAQQDRTLRRELEAARQAGAGHRAAETLIQRSEEFERARQQWPTLKQARIEAGERWQSLEEAHKDALIEQTRAGNRYDSLQQRLSEGEREAERTAREWQTRREEQRTRAAASHTLKRRFPAHWISLEKLHTLLAHYQNATQARLRAETLERELALARRRVEQARYYEEARRFARLISARFQQEKRCDFVVVTGGGPGIMEAANRGAFEANARSIGLNITLPHEQAPNSYITPELAFRFHYFALRKMHFLIHARALVSFPGGYGTMDELFEVLTLIQTGKMPRIPVVLVGRAFWRRVIDFDYLIDEGYIAAGDTGLFEYADDADEIIAALERFYADAMEKGAAERPGSIA